MVPEITAEVDFRLRAQELEIAKAVDENPEGVANLAACLLRQSVIYEGMLRKATHRIAELEAREAVRPGEAADWRKVAKELAPRPWWRGLGR
jgi:hypothetical protein